jgi:hypothetical protein
MQSDWDDFQTKRQEDAMERLITMSLNHFPGNAIYIL